jgi:multisubunit Na+/H+ antiporter MnhE subunit
MADSDAWDISKDELRTMPQFLVHYLRHPMNVIQRLPNWRWPTILITWAGLLIISGTASGLITRKLGDFLVGLFIFPLSGTVMAAVTTAFFYYTFHLFLQKQVSFKALYQLVVLAAIPYLIFRIIVSLVPPADVVGLAFSAALMIVGAVENFALPRRFVMRLIAGIFALFLVFWVYSQIQVAQINMRPKMDVTPESFDKLEKELKHDD